MSNLKQINVINLWSTMELLLSAKNGKASTITIDEVCQGDNEFTKYVVNNLSEPILGNPLYLARVVERLYELCGEPMEYEPLYWIDSQLGGRMSKKVELKTWPWRGLSNGAKHFYASLSLGIEEKSLKYILTPERAKELGYPNWERYTADVGIKSDQFDTEHEAIEYAKEHWLEYFAGDELVFNGKAIDKSVGIALPKNRQVDVYQTGINIQ